MKRITTDGRAEKLVGALSSVEEMVAGQWWWISTSTMARFAGAVSI